LKNSGRCETNNAGYNHTKKHAKSVLTLWGPLHFADEVDANLDASCGFTTANLASLDFGSFSPDDAAATVG